ncbi:MAG: hypothetical protein RLZZ303_3147 [Candidatus Hydrogenedentota bacterium]|jgi:PhoPQ-activated pathogenicity-related protein
MKQVLLFLLALVAFTGNAAADLKAYVSRADDSYSYELTETLDRDGVQVHVIKLKSQTWRDIPWEHWLCVYVPPVLKHTDSSLLVIGGGNNDGSGPRFDSDEQKALGMIAAATGTVCAAISQVPNQPLFDGKHEDAIIAYTHEQYVDGNGEDWPLLYPMVKSAVRAMDTVQTVAREKHGAEIAKFMLTGASKRGWTTWLSAVADERVKAIAPIVIDVLNMDAQMAHQRNTYGGYSEQVADYTERNLQERMDSEMGKQLLGQVDPYSWRAELELPKLLVIGTNDPYWTIDAANLYFDELTGEKHLYYQANTGHDVNLPGVATITKFYDCMLHGTEFPKVTWEQSKDKANALKVQWNGEGGKAVLWQATSPNRDFRESPWSSTPLEGANSAEVSVETPESGYLAYYVEVQYPGLLGLPYGACTKVTVLPDTFAPEGQRTGDLKRVEAASAK